MTAAPQGWNVYFMQAVSGGPIKIGFCRAGERALKLRLGQCQTGSPYRLRVTHVLSGGRDLESHLHHRFRDHRISGEWFVPVPELAELAKAQPIGSQDAQQLSGLLEREYERGFEDGEARGRELTLADVATDVLDFLAQKYGYDPDAEPGVRRLRAVE